MLWFMTEQKTAHKTPDINSKPYCQHIKELF